MLTVSNGWLSNSLSQNRLTRVVNAATANASTDREDDSRYMGPLDSFVDYFFCGGVKKLALDILYELSRNAALLHAESHKAESDRRQDLIDQYQGYVDAYQKQFRLLIPGSSIEFGQHSAQPHERSHCFLIYRNRNFLNPTGIPLYSKAHAVSANSDVNPDRLIPTFTRLEEIRSSDLNQLRIHGQIKLNDQVFEVRFTQEAEPILMCFEKNPLTDSIQEKLSGLWINHIAGQALIDLAGIQKADSALKLNVVFLGLGTGDQRSAQEISAAEIWTQTSQVIQGSFDQACQKMQAPLTAEHAALVLELERLADLAQPTITDKRNLMQAQLKIENLVVKQNKLNKNITRLKTEFTALCHLISYCNDLEMVSIFTLRMTNFLDFIARLSESPMGQKELTDFNEMLNTQSEFLKNFGPEQVTICADLFDPPESDRTRDFGIIPPTSDLHRNTLRQLLTDPTKSVDQIEIAMKQLKIEQEVLLSNKLKQVESGRYVDRAIKEHVDAGPVGRYPSELEKASGVTYFTPETYSRIVWLKKMRDALLNVYNNFTHEELETIGAQAPDHLRKIMTENNAFRNKQRQTFFTSKVPSYQFVRNHDGNPIDYNQWVCRFGIESYKAKTGPIISTLRDVHKMTKANIDALIKRGDMITAVAPKIIQHQENTKSFQKASIKLRKDL